MDTYEWEDPFGPFTISLPEGVFRPTYTTKELAQVLRVDASETVLDMGCGCGILGLIAARAGAKFVIGCDASKRAVETAQENAATLGLAERMCFFVSDLFEALPKATRADVVIGDVSGIPDALASVTGWYPGGRTGAELPVQMLEQVREHLLPSGRLYLPTGTIQNDTDILLAAGRVFRKLTVLATKELPLPAGITETEGVAELIREGIIRLRQKGSRFLWTLNVYGCTEPIGA